MEKHSFETEKHDGGFGIDVEQEAPIVAAIAKAETVKVTAPVTLVEGATIEAMVDGISFVAVVPAGGVSEGEAFAVPYPSATVHSRLPTWKGDICDCCRGGCCMCFTAFMCPLLVHTQVGFDFVNKRSEAKHLLCLLRLGVFVCLQPRQTCQTRWLCALPVPLF